MLKKHRRNPNELAPLMDPHVNPLPQSPEKDPEATLTVEDKEVHTYLTSLFAVPTNAERSGLDNSEPGAWLTIEVLDEEDRSVAAEAKRMVNRVIPSQQTAAPNNRMSNSLSTRTTQQSIVPREIEETATSPSVCSALSSKPESTTTTTTTPGDHHTSIKTAASKSTTPPARSQVKSPLSPLLSSSGPLYRTPKPSHSPRSICPNDSPSTGRSLTSEECDFYPKISPALRTTFTLTPSSSVESALLPKISSRNSTGSRVESPRLCQRSILDQDAVQSDNESPISPSPSKTSSRSCPRKSVDLSMNRSSLSGDDTRGDSEVCLTSQHDVTGCESMSKQRKQHFLSDLSPDDNNTSGLTGKHGAMSAGNAKESTFALIQEYRNALKSRQDSEDEMSSDSLDLTLCEEDSADDEELGAQGRVERRRSTDDRGSPASAHLHHHSAFGPRAHEEGERDLSADQAQQLSRPARVIHSFRSWSDSDSDGSSDDSPSPHSDISPNFHLKSSDAVHQNRTSLNSSTSTEMSGVDQTGCEDPDLEADATAQTLSRLERELRMLVKESGSEVFTVAPSNSRAENPGGNSLYTRRRMSKEEEDEEEALQNDRRSVLLLP
ncbi:uncharacterized protein LOC129407292 [Boleophthalmus pectinirostris]|uniref:uncharacterized protein LOC129407292 n=1 Tax=Boleophthalmus pectinirostris TaxID=150288 RepID=UPI00243054CA|nr:uncharacterized protein LOC129407292 [Boleophthalmus pectinirostris]